MSFNSFKLLHPRLEVACMDSSVGPDSDFFSFRPLLNRGAPRLNPNPKHVKTNPDS